MSRRIGLTIGGILLVVMMGIACWAADEEELKEVDIDLTESPFVIPLLTIKKVDLPAVVSLRSRISSAIEDSFCGNGTTGPYLLTRTGVIPYSEIVVVNGTRQASSMDYLFDYVNGTVAFHRALRPHDIVQIQYCCDPNAAARPTMSYAAPATFALSSNSKLGFTYNKYAAGNVSQGAVLGVTFENKLSSSSKWTNAYLLDQDTDNAIDSAHGRGAFRSRMESSSNRGQVVAMFAEVGSDFKRAAQENLLAGSRVIDIATRYNPSRSVVTTMAFNETEQELSPTARTTTNTKSGGLEWTPGTGSQFRYATKSQSVLDQAGNTLQTENTVYGVRQKIGNRVQADASRELTKTGSSTNQQESSLTSVQVTSNPGRDLSVSTNYAERETVGAGMDSSRSIKVETRPGQLVTLSANLAQQESLQGTTQAQTSARLELNPSKGLKLAGEYSANDAASQKNTVTTMGLTAKPGSSLELSGRIKKRDATNADLLDTTDVGLALAPSQGLQLQAKYTCNPENDQGLVESAQLQSFRVFVKPTNHLTLSGGLDTRQDMTQSNIYTVTREIKLSLALAAGRQFYSSLQQIEMMSSALNRTSSFCVGYSHNIGDRFSLAIEGNLTNPDGRVTAVSDKSDYRVEGKLRAKF